MFDGGGPARAFAHSVRKAALLYMTGVESRPGVLKRRVRPAVVIMLVLLRAQFVQATEEVLWAVTPSWEDPDTDHVDNITPLSARYIDQASGRLGLTRLGRSRNAKPSDVLVSDRRLQSSELTSRAPPATLSRMHSPRCTPFVALSAS